MKSIKHIAVVGILLFLTFFLQSQNCVIPDNGSGTPTLPPIGCEYSSPDEVFMIIDGLPPGTTIELDGIYSNFICCDGSCPCSLPIPPGVCEVPGGSLGGNGHCFMGTMMFNVVGTGDLAGFVRTLFVDVFSEIHTGPRNPGDPVQSFQADLYQLQGELLGDPDFCTFNIIAGNNFGLPSPGQTTLTQLPDGDFNVDSFFDITYQIEFEGCPGSALDGFAGVTTATIKFEIPYVAGNDYIDPGPDFWTAPEASIPFGGEDLPPIPADFFGPGSDPFEGQIDFEGGALDPPPFSDFDVLIERTAPANVPAPYPIGATIDVEIVELRLVSTQPITVSYVGGDIQEWFVEVSLSVIPSLSGFMDVSKENPDGGIFSYMPLNVQPLFTFTLVTDPNEKRTWDTGLDEISPILFNSSINDYPWEHSPIGNDFNATADYPMPLSTVSGECTLELLPYLLRQDDFWVNVTPEGIVVESGGSGYNDGEWYYYPYYPWWNIWFYDHPFDSDRTKKIDVSFTIEQLDPSQDSYATIVFNWATGDWSENGFPRPPLPEDVTTQVLEDLYIVRSIPVFSGVVDEPIFIEQYFYEILEYNPEWISIDISGYNFSLYDGVINHVCKQNDVGGELFELGDAPEMALAYPSTNTMGTFPTCMNEPAAGYVAHVEHFEGNAWFGTSVDHEPEGNAGFCPTFNPDMYNRDECFNDGDAGLIFPDGFTINGPIGFEVVQPCTGTNGAPLGFICQNAQWGADIDIDLHNHIPFGQQAFVNLLIDWDQNGNWGGSIDCPGFTVPEHILVDFQIPNPYDGSISALLAGVTMPIGANPGYVWARFSITDSPVGMDWNGEGFFEYGETEDYLLLIIEDDEEIDFGDAPDPNYRTLLANNAARHAIEPGFFLGVSIDPEFDGQPDAFATGDDNDGNDDEDGVVFLNSFVPGQIATIKVTLADPSGAGGLLDPWIDFNMNGVFDHPAEHLCGGTSCVLNPGPNIINFNVPVGTLVNSQTYARFRLSRNGGLMPFGYAANGEVEDYMVFVHDTITDAKMHFPQYPDPFGWDVNITYPNVMADDWMCSETGAVNDFHFWVSWLDDIYPDNIDEAIQKIHISIHSDIPVDSLLIPYSRPGDLLWERDFVSGEYEYSWYLEGPQGWYDPPFGTVLPNNHLNCFRIDIDGFEDPFVQQEGTIYWMDVYIELVGGAGSDMVTVTLDGVDPDVQPFETWTESNVDLMISGVDGNPPEYGIDPDRIWLWPAMLNADLSYLTGTVSKVEVDILDNCGIGCTIATLYDGSLIVDQKSNTVWGLSTLVLNNPGGFSPDKVTISSYEGAVLEIRIYLESSESYQIGWKTTLDHWNDDAVYSILPDIYWQELIDPFTEESLDMAFVITGIPVDNLDWGDAPDGAAAPQYPTLALNNGASHIIDNITYLGASIDGENNGIPDPNALGDDNDNFDDEDGVFFPNPLIIGQTVTIDVVSSIDGFLNAWVDFNINGNWMDATDQIFSDELLLAGPNSITFNIPASATAGITFARFRFDTNGGLGYDGPGPAGEVEDYEVELKSGDVFKWQQFPDLSFFGMDVDATYDMDGNLPPHILADDFECTMTGPITNIKVWGSWIYDFVPFGIDPGAVEFTLSIHADIPAGVLGEYSMPGEVLWWKTFYPGEFTAELFADNLQEGWYDPVSGFYLPFGDTQCWLYSFDIGADQFIQLGTSDEPIIYWLDVQAQPLVSEPDCRFGWKTSEMHWNDDGVWTVGEEPYNDIWNELIYPPDHELQGESIDLAFEINGYEMTYYLVDLTAFLEGPYNGTDMGTLLNTAGIIPFNQPFDTDPTAKWYYTGTESVSAIPNNVVDWVLVELRDAISAPLATGSKMIEQNAAFILNDGSIVATDGSSMVTFNTMFVNSPYIVIWHRNHLGVLSAYPIGFVAPGVYSYDFTIPAGQAYLNGQKDLGSGIYGMFGGDAAPDGLIDINDKNLWTDEAGNTGYKAEDFNLDTQVDNKDKDDIWVPNEGEGTKVPN